MPLTDFIAATELIDAGPLASFCRAVERAVMRHGGHESAAEDVALALPALLRAPHWLAGPWRQAGAESYRQHPLYIDPSGRFSVVSFVWGPGQFTPIHDHGVWGVIGVLRGAERAQRFCQGNDGRLEPLGGSRLMQPGDIDVLKPREGDIHRVANALADQISISIHAYGADIGAVCRRTFAEDGTPQLFVSGYSAVAPALTRA